MGKINHRIFLASFLSFVFFFSFFQSSQAGFFDWFNWFRKSDSQNTTEVVPGVKKTSNLKSSSSSSLSAELMNNWKTYHNKEHKFEFKYPVIWKMTSNDAEGPNYKVIARVVNPARAGVPDTDVPIEAFLVRSLNYPCKGKTTNLTGRTGTDTGWEEGFGNIYYRTLCIKTGGWPITITLSAYDQPSRVIMERILFTFKFIEPSSSSSLLPISKSSSSLNDYTQLNDYTHYDSGITFKYPKDWKFDAVKNYFTTSNYQDGQSGARIEFIYGLSGNYWQATVSAMYGSKSVNTQTSINGKVALRTTYPSDDHLIALSMPFANNTAFMSLLLKYQAPGRLAASYKDSYEPVLQTVADNAVLPSTMSSAWHAYLNSTYSFSFNHPPLTAVISDGTYFKNSVASYLAMVRYGFHQLLFVFTKPIDQSLRAWYDNAFAGMSPARGPVEKIINGYSAIDVTFNDMDTDGRHIMIAKNGVVVNFLFSNATVDSPLTSNQQKLIDSFLFTK